jgi:hypothetical protein
VIDAVGQRHKALFPGAERNVKRSGVHDVADKPVQAREETAQVTLGRKRSRCLKHQSQFGAARSSFIPDKFGAH